MSDRIDEDRVEELRQRPGRRTGRLVSVLLFVVIVAVSVAGGAIFYLHRNFAQAGPLAAAANIVIPRGASVQAIGRLLQERGVIDDAQLFALGVRLFGGDQPLRAGEYAFVAKGSARDAVRVLQTADPVMHRLTVPEGLLVSEITALLELTGGLEGALSPIEEGTLLPETYHFRRGDKRADVVARMQASMEDILDELWPARAQGLPLRSKREAVTLASIVERETGLAAERTRVAAVFTNRLRRGMKLQSDPTVAYALTNGTGALGRSLRRDDLKFDHPYNTYVIKGLPPGPIANPGKASLLAVLNPAKTKDLYFVADGKGGHAFARTLTEHNRNVSRWRQIQRQMRKSGKKSP